MRNKFTESELSIIDTYYVALPRVELMSLLPGRSWNVIKVIANRRGLKRSNEACRVDRGCPRIVDFSAIDTEEKA